MKIRKLADHHAYASIEKVVSQLMDDMATKHTMLMIDVDKDKTLALAYDAGYTAGLTQALAILLNDPDVVPKVELTEETKNNEYEGVKDYGI